MRAGWIRRFWVNPTSLTGALVVAAVVLAAILAPWISPFDPLEQDIAARLSGPSPAHFLGTDTFGRDVLSRLMHAARISLVIGVASIDRKSVV